MADPLSASASIAGLLSLADTVFRYVFKYARGAAGAKEEIQSLAHEINNLSSVLRNLNALASELEAEGQTFEPALKLAHLIDCQQTFEKIKNRVKKATDSFESRSKWEGIQRQLKWPFSAPETKSLLADVSRCKETIALAASADNMRTLQLCLAKQTEQSSKLDRMIEKLDRIEIQTQIHIDQKKALVLDFFLKPETNPQPSLAYNIKLRHATTGGWLLSSDKFTDWMKTRGSRLWLNGIPGGGKTILASAIIQESLARSSADVGVSFFFCDYKNAASLTVVNILGAIASQIALQHDEAYKLLEDYYTELHPLRALNKNADPDELRALIANMSELFRQVYLVVDGIDECGDDTASVAEALAELATTTESTSIALFSRNELEIRAWLEDNYDDISIEAHTEDLELYVRSEMERRMQTGRLVIQNLKVKDEIAEELVKRANGMFRWVACQLDYLEECTTDADRRRALTELPPTLPDTYKRLLERVNRRPARVRKMVQMSLHFIAYFPYSLTIDQLREAISTPSEIGSRIDESNTISEREIALGCSSLVRKSADGRCFEFSHFSVREFLEDDSLSQTPGLAIYAVCKSKSFPQLATQCVKFLQLQNFDMPQSGLGERLDSMNNSTSVHSFYLLAATTWPMLAREGLNDKDYSLLESVKSLFHPSKTTSFRAWTLAILLDIVRDFLRLCSDPAITAKAVSYLTDDTFRPLHMACALNLPEICEYLVNEGAEINQKSSLGTPLLLAATSFLGFMSEVGGFNMIRPSFYSNYLPIASRRVQAFECLIKVDANMSASSGSRRNHSEFVLAAIIDFHLGSFAPTMKLISRGTVPSDSDMDALNDYLDTYFPHDKARGLELPLLDFIRYLKKTSAHDTDWGLKLGRRLWSLATKMGFAFTHDANLTDSRISLSIEGLLQKTRAALQQDDPIVLQLCLDDGRINVTGAWALLDSEYSGTLLHYAVQFDSTGCADLLLKLGSDPKAKDCRGDAAVHYCDGSSDGNMLKILVEHNIKLSTPKGDGLSLWHLCAQYPHWNASFVDVLFRVDPEATREAVLSKAKNGHTPLTFALDNIQARNEGTQARNEERALLYIDYCNAVENFWESHGSVLPRALEVGSAKVLDRLLSLGFRPASVRDEDSTPLHKLRADASVEWINLLKKLFPQADERRFNGRLPLESYLTETLRFGCSPNEAAVKALMFNDVFGSKDDKGRTPWEYLCNLREVAAASAFPPKSHWGSLNSILSILLDLGAMERYEDEAQTCGLDLLFPAILKDIHRIERVSDIISAQTLEKAVHVSKHWKPHSKLAVRFLKQVLNQEDGETVEVLLQNGLDVHQRVDRESAIEHACGPSLIEQLCTVEKRGILDCLLNRTKASKLREFSLDSLGFSILHRVAMSSGDPESLRWLVGRLVEQGADLNAINRRTKTYQRMTPLVYHILSESYVCAEHLLHLGADPNLAGGDDGDFCDEFSCDAAGASVIQGSSFFLQVLLDHAKRTGGEINWQRPCIVSVAVDEYEERNIEGATSLHRACFNGDMDCVQFFVQHNLIGIDQPADGDETALYCAVLANEPSIVEYLVSNGASTNHSLDDGSTALHAAAANGYLEVAKILVQLGAVESTDEDGRTPSMAAFLSGHHAVANFLEEAVGDTGSKVSAKRSMILLGQLEKAIKHGDLDTCKWLVARGCPINGSMPRCHGCSPLIRAMLRDKLAIARWMLESGASVQAYPCPKHAAKNFTIINHVSSVSSWVSLLPVVLSQYLAEGGDFFNGLDAPLHGAIQQGNHEGLQMVLEFWHESVNEIGGATVTHSGRNELIDVLSVTQSKAVRHFLLVGRFSEQSRIEAAGQDVKVRQGQTGVWSGIRKALNHLAQQPQESMIDYCRRLGQFKRRVRGNLGFYLDGLVFR
ncbi:Ankyrin repeat domain-containing protein [Paramyrothecium foliicola]|nr:Ankyrin repeat domain-containing protein [Paramyrothecium foliicola]